MPAFAAQVELLFEAASLEACGIRLHELTLLLRENGVELTNARVEPTEAKPFEGAGGSQYAP